MVTTYFGISTTSAILKSAAALQTTSASYGVRPMCVTSHEIMSVSASRVATYTNAGLHCPFMVIVPASREARGSRSEISQERRTVHSYQQIVVDTADSELRACLVHGSWVRGNVPWSRHQHAAGLENACTPVARCPFLEHR